jgi:F0F1-type ATP synthase assembly protein I
MTNLENPPPKSKAGAMARQFALATELPFLVAAGALGGGAIGYFLDRWLNTAPWLMLAVGAVGFFAAVRDMLRRLDKHDRDAATKP